MAMALNPAGIAGMADQFQLGAALFMPYRGYDASGTALVAPGSIDSDANLFAIPNLAYTYQLDSESTLGVTLYGNGGMNTSYPAVTNTSPGCGGGSGVFCGGKAGVDLMQAFLSATYARELGPLKIGIAPTLAVQRFKARGLGAFGGFSSDAANLTNNGYDYSVGGGLRGGIEMDLSDSVRLGLSGQTKMYMSKFDKYAGLFAEQGDFDIPASITAGIAFDVAPDVTLMADYQHIFYSDVKSVGNSSALVSPLGSDNGPGFGWDDINVFKFGAEWRANDRWTFRAGYAYSENPIGSQDVMLNILAPGVVKHHITGGFSYKASEHSTLEFAGMYVPEVSVTGAEMAPGSSVKIHMYQFQFLGGWTYDF
jgi:long-chain fatty acid transport protein